MATHNNSGDSIECNESQIAVRKCFTNNPTIARFDKLRLFKYKSSIRSVATILTELPIIPPATELQAIILVSSKLDKGDILNCETMEIYTERRLPNPMPIVSNFSHVHGIQGHRMNCFTFAKIVTPWRIFMERADSPKIISKG